MSDTFDQIEIGVELRPFMWKTLGKRLDKGFAALGETEAFSSQRYDIITGGIQPIQRQGVSYLQIT